tara:strand:- start:394 stop:879 length:486 start_codon:yes stop_codon:yes gene_type:complete
LDLEILISIHTTYISKRDKHFNIKRISKPNVSDSEKLLNPILDISMNILNKCNKINYDKNNYYIEFQQRNCSNEKYTHPFTWHKDDFSAVPWRTYTVIFYIRKDSTIKNGDLKYIINDNEYIKIINTGDILCFDGDILHKPQNSYGFGCRDTIVVFFKKLI